MIAAVILAGGKGERLGGVVKAALRIGDLALLERVTAIVAPHASPLLVACGLLDPSQLGLEPRHVAIPDLPIDYAGPLAGVAAAADWLLRQPAPPDYLLSIAVDTPFAPPDLLPRLLAELPAASGAAIAHYGGQDHPTNALWRLPSLAPLPAAMAAGTAPRSLRRLAADLGAVPCPWLPSPAGDPFASINTPADLAAAQARALGS